MIVCVLGVWGTVAHKLINGISPKQPKLAPENLDQSFNPKTPVKQDSFTIEEAFRDPFLGTLAPLQSKRQVKNSKISNNIPPVYQPILTYGGLIKLQSASDKVFIVNINNNQYLLKKGQIADSVKVLRGNDKEIVLRYNNKSLTIKRQ